MKHPLCVKHPPSVKYVRSFLSELIRKVSDGHCPPSRQRLGPSLLFRGGLCLLQLRSTPFSFPTLQTPVEQGAPWAAAPSGLPSVRHCGEWEEGRVQGPSCLLPGVFSSGSISSVVLVPPAPWNLPSPTQAAPEFGKPHLLPAALHRTSPGPSLPFLEIPPTPPHQVTYIQSITSQISPPNVAKILQPFLQVRIKAKRWNLGLNHKGRLDSPANALSLPAPSTRLPTQNHRMSCTRRWRRS